MKLTLELTGLNLEKLLTLAAQAGVRIYGIKRTQERSVRVTIENEQKTALKAICDRYGWEMRVIQYGTLLYIVRWMKAHKMIPLTGLFCVVLVLLSSRMIWRISIVNAGKDIGEIRTILRECRVGPGTLKIRTSASELRQLLLLRLPDLSYIGVSYEGSTLVIDCQPMIDGERVLTGGESKDLVAVQDGVITGLVVHSGTPQVQIGQAVRTGDLLIKGEERGEKQTVYPIAAQGIVTARVWAKGNARVSRYLQRTVETGAVRRRVTLCTPWYRHVVQEAQPFSAQDKSTRIEQVVGLYLPLWREIDTLAEIEVFREARSDADAASMAQAAAQQIAKNKCPVGALILDKTVEYSMIDHEYVYATVVLEYEQNIAIRPDEADAGL